MSKIGRLNLELTESANDLGFASIEEAEQAGYRPDYNLGRMVYDATSELNEAHEAWLKEKHQVLHILESVKSDIIDLNDGDNNHVAIGELDYVIDFIEKGEI